MLLELRGGLPFVRLTVVHRGRSTEVVDVLVDTGSASTLLSADIAADPGVAAEPADRVRTLRGVGGREVVFARTIGHLVAGPCAVTDFEVEIGGMDYGFPINGILGMDFLVRTGAVLDLRELTIDRA